MWPQVLGVLWDGILVMSAGVGATDVVGGL